MFEFLSKNYKVIFASAIALATVGVSNYLLNDRQDEHEEKKLKEQQEQERIENEARIKEEQAMKNLGMTQEEAREKMQGLLKKVKKSSEELFKEQIKKDIKVEYYGQLLSDKTIKVIMHRSVLFCLDSLMKVHERTTAERQKKYYQIPEYVAKANELLQNYFYFLNISMENITSVLEISFDLFQASLRYWQNQTTISKGFIRDLAWHFMAEAKVKIPLTREEYVRYLTFICDQLPKQEDELRTIITKASPQIQRIVILSRSEDKAFFDLNISDLDAIKALSIYSADEECKALLVKRNNLLNSLYQEE